MKIEEIRGSITASQAAALKPIFTAAFGEPPSDSFLQRLNEKQDLSMLLAMRDDEIIGFKIGYQRFHGIFFSWLGAVAAEHQRAGIGRRLLQHQHQLCRERGYVEIQTEAAATNQPMLILNLQEGFEVSGVHLGHNDKLTVQLRKRFQQNNGS